MYNVGEMAKYTLPKKSGRNFCDELWAKLVRLEFKNQCPICASLGLPLDDKMLNAHHLISRRVFKYRWDTDNGILICPKHHEFDLYLSAHTAPWGFEDWMKNNLQYKYDKWVDNRKDLETQETVYEEIYLKLEEQHKIMTGEYHMIKRLDMYNLHKNKEAIKFSLKMNNTPISKIATLYGVSELILKKFLKSQKII